MSEKLPANLSSYRKTTGELFFRYTFPDQRRKGIGSNREDAVAIAQALNIQLDRVKQQMKFDNLLAPCRALSNNLFSRVCERFRVEWVNSPLRNYSSGSIKLREGRLREYIREWGSLSIITMDTFTVAQYLKSKTPESARQHRNLLAQLFTYAMEEGLIKANPVTETAKRSQPKRQKHRHTWYGYSVVLAAAEPWLARTMKLALYSVQRRGDLVVLHRDQVNMSERTIRVTQRKTGEDLLIGMGNDLFEVMKECVGTGIPCPYLVHMRPQRMPNAKKQNKLHPFAVNESYLSHAFADARDRSGAYEHIEKALRPSFHDLRALGMFALHKAGFPTPYIQALAGHANEAMTLQYLAGHETVKPLRVEAGLSVAAIDWTTVDWQD